ncbi:MAG: hypothetical protein LLF76_05585 [Planctomycetaceae bacterium]|nr:hypothetical protein [Planctomycetaceae bacterium]
MNKARLAAMVVVWWGAPLWANLLTNPGFEDGPLGQIKEVPIPGWLTWNTDGWHHSDPGCTIDAKAVMLWSSNSGIYQDFAVTAGRTYRFSGYMHHKASDPLRGGDKTGQLRAEWYSASNSMLREDVIGIITKDDLTNTWLYRSTDLIAPPNAVTGRFLIRMYSTSGDGVVNYDNASVVPVNSPDYNADFHVDYDDFRQLAAAWLQSNIQYDLNDDSLIDIQDLKLFAQDWMSWLEPSGAQAVSVDPSTVFQEIDGFGASLTDSSAWLLYEFLNPDERQAVLTDLFDPEEGIGLSYLRQPMGSSDLRLQEYSYDDLPYGVTTDYMLTYFSIAYDEQYIVPTLQEIVAVNPNVKLMGSPWSPPVWMKTSGQIGWGSLKSSVYPTYSNYFVKYIQAYAAHGLAIDAITLQNEPYYEPGSYAGCRMEPADQVKLVKEMGPAFAAAGISTKILVWDHNWDNTAFPLAVLADAQARAYIDGVAWHHYGGDVSAQSTVHDAYPDKNVYFTEGSDGTWNDGGFDNDLIRNGTFMIATLRNWAKTVVKWNLALDENNGPKIAGGCDTCYGVVTVNRSTRAVTPRPHYYALGHAAKFLRPGARRIASDTATIQTVAFRNTDGSMVLYAVNPAGSSDHIKIQWNGQRVFSLVPARSIMTFCWPNAANAKVEVYLTTGDQNSLIERRPALYFHN